MSNRRWLQSTGSHAALMLSVAVAFTAASHASAQTAPSGAIALPTLSVEGETTNSKPLQTDTGLATMPSTVQDTPQAVNVISGEQMKVQGVASLEQALRNVPGITVSIGEGGTLNGDQFKIRGFDASSDVYLDGLRDFGVYTRDSFNYQEVQVLKGPSGAMFGRGTTGGAVNTRSKSPTLGESYSFDGYIGNGDYYRGLVDLNHQINDTIAVRVNLMGNSTGVVDRNYVKSDRWGIAPTIAFGIGTDTTFTLGYFHQNDDRVPDYGVVVAQPPGSIIAKPSSEFGVPRTTFLGYTTDNDRTSADIVTARLSHKPADWLTLTSDSRLGIYSRYFQYTSTDRCDQTIGTNFCSNNVFTSPATAQAGMGGSGPYDQSAWGAQNISTARADFELGQFRNQFIGGFDLSYQNTKKTFYFYKLPAASTGIYTLNDKSVSRTNIGRSLYNTVNVPAPGYTVFSPTLATIANSTATATSIISASGDASDIAGFLTDRLWFTGAWSVIGSVRLDNYNANYNSITLSNLATPLKSTSFLTSPRASLVFEPDENQTYYFSYGKSATPQGTAIVGTATPLTASASALQPELSESFELGAKFALFEGRLGLTASIFDVKKDNATQTDPLTGVLNVQSSQKQEVQGVELGVIGKVTDAWTVNANYTYLDAKVIADNSCSTTGVLSCKPNIFTIGTPVTLVPQSAATLWTDYKLDAVVEGLTVSGGITYQDSIVLGYQFVGTAPNLTGIARKAIVPYSLSFDAVATYKVENYRFALNAYNLTDRLNYTQLFSNRAVPAAGRTVIFSVGATY